MQNTFLYRFSFGTVSGIPGGGTILFTIWLILPLAATATNGAQPPDPLFAGDGILQITLSAPFRQIHRERDKTRTWSGATLSWTGGDERPGELPVQLQVRGNSRLDEDTCKYVPLRILFEKKAVKNTLFRHQKKLKLVTQCGNRPAYRDYLIQEYLIYRMFNLVTDTSFRVRLAEITYLDENALARTAPGFFIENRKRLGKRLGLEPVRVREAAPESLDPRQTSLVSLFQFMVGNTDWSATLGESGEDCCHNAKLLGQPGEPYLPVPYDFDFSGLLNTGYAVPSPGLNQKTVKTRVYRGFCQADLHALSLARADMDRHRNQFMSLFRENTLLSARAKRRSVAWLESYFRIADNGKRWHRKVVSKCRR